MSDTTTQRRREIMDRIFHETKHQDYLIDAGRSIGQFVADIGGNVEDAEWATQEFHRFTEECGYGGGRPDYVRAVYSTALWAMLPSRPAEGEPTPA